MNTPLESVEHIEGKSILPSNQLLHCPRGHDILVSRPSLAATFITAGPFDYSAGYAVGTRLISMVPVPREGSEVDIHCPSCPDEEILHLMFRTEPGSKFRTYAEIISK